MRSILVFILLVLLLSSCKTSWISGRWEGLGQEKSDGTTWALNLEAQTKNKINIDYPGHEIETNWLYLFHYEDHLYFREEVVFANLEDEIVSVYFIVEVNRITEDIMELKYYDASLADQSKVFEPENILATAMSRRISKNKINKNGNPQKYYYSPKVNKWPKVAKVKKIK